MRVKSVVLGVALLLAAVFVVNAVWNLDVIRYPAPGEATVRFVLDGDTVLMTVDGEQETVRLLNVDTPETRDRFEKVGCLGPEATAYLQSLLSPGDVVRLELDVEERDRFDRLLAGVYVGDVLVNAEVARVGLGQPVVFEPNDRFYDEVLAASREAQREGVGLYDPDLDCAATG